MSLILSHTLFKVVSELAIEVDPFSSSLFVENTWTFGRFWGRLLQSS